LLGRESVQSVKEGEGAELVLSPDIFKGGDIMAWVFTCKRCGYRVVALRRKDAQKFFDYHIIKSHNRPHEPEFDEQNEIIRYKIPDSDYYIIKELPSFPALVV